MGLGLSSLRLGLGARFSGGGFTVSIGSGPFTTGTELTATVNGLEGGETVTYQWTDDGVNITGATSSTYTAAIGTDSVADASQIRCVVVVDGGDSITSSAREIRYAPGSVTESSLTDITIDDDVLDIDFASDFTTSNLTGTYVITGLPTGVVDDSDGTASGTATGAPGSFTPQVVFTDQYGRTITGDYAQDTVYRAQATGGVDLDLSFTETSGGTQDLLANWTTNGNTLTLVSVSPTLPADVEISDAGVLTIPVGLPIAADETYTLTMVDEYGRETSDTFTFEITEGTVALNPTVSLPSYTAPSGGTPASIAVPGSYTGGDTLTLYGVTGTEAIVVTEAQLIAGSGGTNTSEFFSVSAFSFADGSFDLTGLTDETADAVVFVVVEDNNGGSSGLVTSVTGITGLDFTAPSFSSAEVGTVDADTLVIDASEALFDVSATTLDPAAFTLTGNTITGVSIVGGDIHLTLGTTVTSGDDYTGDLSYVSDGEIVDIAGEALPSFTSQNVTNNVPAPSSNLLTSDFTDFAATHWGGSGGTANGDGTATLDMSANAVFDMTEAQAADFPAYDPAGENFTLTYDITNATSITGEIEYVILATRTDGSGGSIVQIISSGYFLNGSASQSVSQAITGAGVASDRTRLQLGLRPKSGSGNITISNISLESAS